MSEFILVTNWDKVEKDNFYLQKERGNSDEIKLARKLQKDGALYDAYIVSATNYAIYKTMDAQQCLINGEGEVILVCENAVIDRGFDKVFKYDY